MHEKYHIPTLNSKQISSNGELLQLIDKGGLAEPLCKLLRASEIPNHAFSDSKNRILRRRERSQSAA